MDPKIQLVPGYYVWDVPGQPAAVYLSLDALDRLEAEVLRGFASIPKRVAEVGGVLLGVVEPDVSGRTIVRIRDFEPVACEHKRGPAYSLSEDESHTFDQTCEHWKPDPSRPLGAVGHYRSNTREEPGLDPEDLARLDRHFPQPEAVVLLVRPSAEKACTAGFLMRENGAFPPGPPLEFPFRRRDLTGVEPPLRRPVFERPGRASNSSEPQQDRPVAGARLMATPEARASAPSASGFRASWVWLPLFFVFLLIGVFLGYQLALGMGSRSSTTSAATQDFSLGLTVTRAEDNLSVRWNRDSAVIRSAQKGLLEIEDGGYAKPVDLDPAHLQNGSIIYRHNSGTVRFRLVVYVNPRVSVTETLDWHE